MLNCHVFTERCSDLTSKDERSNHICFLKTSDKAWFTVHLSTWYSSHLMLNCHIFTERCSDLTSKGERSHHICFLNMLDKAWFTVHLSTWYSSHLVLNCHVFTERCSDLTSKGERSNHIWYLTAAKSATKSGKLVCGKMIHTPTPSKLDRGAEEQSFAQQLLRTLSSYSYELFKTSWTKQLLK